MFTFSSVLRAVVQVITYVARVAVQQISGTVPAAEVVPAFPATNTVSEAQNVELPNQTGPTPEEIHRMQQVQAFNRDIAQGVNQTEAVTLPNIPAGDLPIGYGFNAFTGQGFASDGLSLDTLDIAVDGSLPAYPLRPEQLDAIYVVDPYNVEPVPMTLLAQAAPDKAGFFATADVDSYWGIMDLDDNPVIPDSWSLGPDVEIDIPPGEHFPEDPPLPGDIIDELPPDIDIDIPPGEAFPEEPPFPVGTVDELPPDIEIDIPSGELFPEDPLGGPGGYIEASTGGDEGEAEEDERRIPPVPEGGIPVNLDEMEKEVREELKNNKNISYPEALEYVDYDSTSNLVNPDSSGFQETGIRIQAKFIDTVTGDKYDLSLNYDWERGEFGTIKPASGR